MRFCRKYEVSRPWKVPWGAFGLGIGVEQLAWERLEYEAVAGGAGLQKFSRDCVENFQPPCTILNMYPFSLFFILTYPDSMVSKLRVW